MLTILKNSSTTSNITNMIFFVVLFTFFLCNSHGVKFSGSNFLLNAMGAPTFTHPTSEPDPKGEEVSEVPTERKDPTEKEVLMEEYSGLLERIKGLSDQIEKAKIAAKTQFTDLEGQMEKIGEIYPLSDPKFGPALDLTYVVKRQIETCRFMTKSFGTKDEVLSGFNSALIKHGEDVKKELQRFYPASERDQIGREYEKMKGQMKNQRSFLYKHMYTLDKLDQDLKSLNDKIEKKDPNKLTIGTIRTNTDQIKRSKDKFEKKLREIESSLETEKENERLFESERSKFTYIEKSKRDDLIQRISDSNRLICCSTCQIMTFIGVLLHNLAYPLSGPGSASSVLKTIKDCGRLLFNTFLILISGFLIYINFKVLVQHLFLVISRIYFVQINNLKGVSFLIWSTKVSYTGFFMFYFFFTLVMFAMGICFLYFVFKKLKENTLITMKFFKKEQFGSGLLEHIPVGSSLHSRGSLEGTLPGPTGSSIFLGSFRNMPGRRVNTDPCCKSYELCGKEGGPSELQVVQMVQPEQGPEVDQSEQGSEVVQSEQGSEVDQSKQGPGGELVQEPPLQDPSRLQVSWKEKLQDHLEKLKKKEEKKLQDQLEKLKEIQEEEQKEQYKKWIVPIKKRITQITLKLDQAKREKAAKKAKREAAKEQAAKEQFEREQLEQAAREARIAKEQAERKKLEKAENTQAAKAAIKMALELTSAQGVLERKDPVRAAAKPPQSSQKGKGSKGSMPQSWGDTEDSSGSTLRFRSRSNSRP